MTLIKSILLGSAAGLVAVASAQAADLPTRKAAPVEYVRVCNVGGITGWTMPGSDTCVKISGYMTAHFIGGNISQPVQLRLVGSRAGADRDGANPTAIEPAGPISLRSSWFKAAMGRLRAANLQRHHRQARSASRCPTSRMGHSIAMRLGWNIRANLGFDFASNTAYGPLIGHMDFNADLGNGLDSPRGDYTLYVNTGYVTWAGITAGKAQSFYSFIGGGDNWNNFFSPDQKGFNEPLLMAYTASFGGGFTATLAAQSPGHERRLRRRHQR